MEDVLEIYHNELRKCTDKSVTSVLIPSSIKKIGPYAFFECTAIKTVEFGGTVAEWDNVKFKDGLLEYVDVKSVKCSDGVWETPVVLVEDGRMKRCLDKTATNVTIPEGVTYIAAGAFYDCNELKSVFIPSSVTDINACVFHQSQYKLTVIENVEFGGTMAEWDNVTGKINLFEYADIKSVKCSDGVWEMPVLLVENGCVVRCLDKTATSVTIPDGITKIDICAFSGCTSLSSVVIPSSVELIYKDAFKRCPSLSKVILADDFEKVTSEWFDTLKNENPNYEIVCTEGSATYKAIKRSAKLKTHLKSLNVSKEDLEFQKAKNKKIVQVQKAGADAVLSSLLSGLADSSFELLSNSKSSTVALIKIGKNAGFFKFSADSSKWLPKIKKVIEAFSDSSKTGAEIFALVQEQNLLTEIPAKKAMYLTVKADSDGFLNLFATGALRKMNYEGLKSVALFGITQICAEAFYGCTSLSSAAIPDSVAEIGSFAFKNCNINELSHPCLTIKNGVAINGKTAEYCSTQNRSITIPDGVKELADSSFKNCTSLSSVVLPSGVKVIWQHVFSGCSSLSSVVIPNSISFIAVHSFSLCHSLKTVEFGGTVAEWSKIHGTNEIRSKASIKCADGEAKL